MKPEQTITLIISVIYLLNIITGILILRNLENSKIIIENAISIIIINLICLIGVITISIKMQKKQKDKIKAEIEKAKKETSK